MADQTQNYAFSLPEVDGSEDLWGDLLNQNWSDLDALLKTREDGVDTLTSRVTMVEGDLNSAEGDIDGLVGRVTTAEGDIDDLDGRVTSAAKLSGGADANFTTMPQVGGDPIVESGSNSDGDWMRWADGTQVTTTLTVTFPPGGGGGDFLSAIWDYPQPFSQVPYIAPPTLSSDITYWDDLLDRGKVTFVGRGPGSTVSAAPLRLWTDGSSTPSEVRGVHVYATGRWK